jgi:G3E family GTPase
MKEATGDFRIPVYVVSGFLGSGKTTFLRKALREPVLSGSLLLVNEVGEFGVDDRLIRLDGTPTVLLGNGCLCCTANEGLSTALHKVVETDFGQKVERIIIETTGLADPLPVISTIAINSFLAANLRVELVLTIVDAMHADEEESASLDYIRQIENADVVLLSKTDMVSTARVLKTKEMVVRLNPLCQCVHVQDTTLGELLALPHSQRADRLAYNWFPDLVEDQQEPSRTRLRLGSRSIAPGSHALRVNTFCLELGEELDWVRFTVWLSALLHAHGNQILRIKGFLALEDNKLPVVVNCVHHVIYFPEHLESWPSEDRRSFLIFVVKEIFPEQLLRSLQACVRTVKQLPN